MKHFSFVFVAALALSAGGCKKKAPDCAAAMNHSMDLAKDGSMKGAAADPKMKQAFIDMGVKHCKDDKWSDDAVRCMMDAKSETDAKACYGKLSADQQKKMNDDAWGAKPADAGGMQPTDTGSAAAGSGSAMGSGSGDMGSAAAGSGSAMGSGSAAAGSGSAGSGSAK
jgi:hypothetical protein